jgi:protein-disulfide isomerase
MPLTRSNLVVLALLGAAVLFGQTLQGRLGMAKPLAFEDVAGLPGWRQVAFKGITPGGSATSAVFAGLGEDDSSRLSPEALCRHLYPMYPTVGPKISAAVFTDINCPNCASLNLKLARRLDRLELNRIELPLLGESSEAYAKAIIAAGLIGDAALVRIVETHQRGPQLSTALLREVANTGYDAGKLESTANGPEVAGVLKRNRDAADTLGIWGTPALTIGQTLVLGDVRSDILDRLIELEATRFDGSC